MHLFHWAFETLFADSVWKRTNYLSEFFQAAANEDHFFIRLVTFPSPSPLLPKGGVRGRSFLLEVSVLADSDQPAPAVSFGSTDTQGVFNDLVLDGIPCENCDFAPDPPLSRSSPLRGLVTPTPTSCGGAPQPPSSYGVPCLLLCVPRGASSGFGFPPSTCRHNLVGGFRPARPQSF